MRRIVVAVLLAACTGGGSPAPPSETCTLAAHAEGFAAFGIEACDFPDRSDYSPEGVWAYDTNCEFVEASPNFQQQVGASCTGELALCDVQGNSASWQDIGPTGEGIGMPAELTVRGYTTEHGGVWFAAYGTVEVSSPDGSCSAPVDVFLLCGRGGGSQLPANKVYCTKISHRGVPACGVEAGWVRSEFHFTRVRSCS
jgi:hypothetical protein